MSSRQRAAVLVLLSAIAVAVLVRPFLSGLLGALVMTAVASPIYHRMRVRRHPRIAAALVVVGAVVLVVAPGAALLFIALDQLPESVRWVERIGLWERVAALHIAGAPVGGRIAEMGHAALSWLSRQMLALAGSVISASINLIVAVFGLYYLLLSGDTLWQRTRGLLPFSPASADRLRERFRNVTHATILGTLSIAALQGTVAGVAFWDRGTPALSRVGRAHRIRRRGPVIGSGLVWIPATVLLIAMQRYSDAVALGLIGAIVVANVDNVVRPLVYRRVSCIHPMITLVGAFAAIRYFGPLGVLFGPLGLAYFFEVLALYRREYGSLGAKRGVRSALGEEGSLTGGGCSGHTVAQWRLSLRFCL